MPEWSLSNLCFIAFEVGGPETLDRVRLGDSLVARCPLLWSQNYVMTVGANRENANASMLKFGPSLAVDQTLRSIRRKAHVRFIRESQIVDSLMEGVIDPSQFQLDGHEAFVQRHPAVAFEVRSRRRFLDKMVTEKPTQFDFDSFAIQVAAESPMQVIDAYGLPVSLVGYQGQQMYTQWGADGSRLAQSKPLSDLVPVQRTAYEITYSPRRGELLLDRQTLAAQPLLGRCNHLIFVFKHHANVTHKKPARSPEQHDSI